MILCYFTTISSCRVSDGTYGGQNRGDKSEHKRKGIETWKSAFFYSICTVDIQSGSNKLLHSGDTCPVCFSSDCAGWHWLAVSLRGVSMFCLAIVKNDIIGGALPRNPWRAQDHPWLGRESRLPSLWLIPRFNPMNIMRGNASFLGPPDERGIALIVMVKHGTACLEVWSPAPWVLYSACRRVHLLSFVSAGYLGRYLGRFEGGWKVSISAAISKLLDKRIK
ncbi:hypothetical protein F5144DRAFT_251280 [Chaetomium tenue]|uniref:Uncharacterized protein n=1 Tax=Chaetomium tenue TaxID=1854479 RepID=A0ACB7P8U2_9PEZI|nr:hypothetical protein F5144DRAFT_251280 [Chaetomium globosum]